MMKNKKITKLPDYWAVKITRSNRGIFPVEGKVGDYYYKYNGEHKLYTKERFYSCAVAFRPEIISWEDYINLVVNQHFPSTLDVVPDDWYVIATEYNKKWIQDWKIEYNVPYIVTLGIGYGVKNGHSAWNVNPKTYNWKQISSITFKRQIWSKLPNAVPEELPEDWFIVITGDNVALINEWLNSKGYSQIFFDKASTQAVGYILNDSVISYDIKDSPSTYFKLKHRGESLFDVATEINLETFKKLVMKEITREDYTSKNTQQYLTRDQLVNLIPQFDCSEWRKHIQELLDKAPYCLGSSQFDVSGKLEILNDLGSKEQKEVVSRLGIKLPKSYKERQDEAEFKVGDKVKITRAAKEGENGWDIDWDVAMTKVVGNIYVVKKIGNTGIGLYTETGEWYFPYFVLEKVKEEYIPFTFEDAKEIIGRVVLLNRAKKMRIITEVSEDGVEVSSVFKRFSDLLRDWTFEDKPCGKLKE